MINIQTIDNPQYHFKTEDVQRIFENYNLRPENLNLFDYVKFAQDIVQICTVSYVPSDGSYTYSTLPQVPHYNFNIN